MCDSRMAALMLFLQIMQYKQEPMHVQCIIRTWNALRLQHHASQALMMHFVGKCAIFMHKHSHLTYCFIMVASPLISLVCSCLGLQEEEPQTAWASHIADAS